MGKFGAVSIRQEPQVHPRGCQPVKGSGRAVIVVQRQPQLAANPRAGQPVSNELPHEGSGGSQQTQYGKYAREDIRLHSHARMLTRAGSWITCYG